MIETVTAAETGCAPKTSNRPRNTGNTIKARYTVLIRDYFSDVVTTVVAVEANIRPAPRIKKIIVSPILGSDNNKVKR